MGDSQTAGDQWITDVGVTLSATMFDVAAAGSKTGSEGFGQWEQALPNRPKYVLVKFGLNDVSTGYEPGLTVPQREQLFEDDTRRLLSQIIAFGSIPLLVKNIQLDIPTTYTVNDERNNETVAYDARKDILATELGVGVIDLYTAFGTQIPIDPAFHVDGTNLHYNALGQTIVGDTISDYFTTNGLTP